MCFSESHSRTTGGEKPEGIGRQVGERPLEQRRAAALRLGRGIPSQTVPGSIQPGGWQAGCEGRAIRLEGLIPFMQRSHFYWAPTKCQVLSKVLRTRVGLLV